MNYARLLYLVSNELLTCTCDGQTEKCVCFLMSDTGAIYDVVRYHHPIGLKVWPSCSCCNKQLTYLSQASVPMINLLSRFGRAEIGRFFYHSFLLSINCSLVSSGSKDFCSTFFSFAFSSASVFEISWTNRRLTVHEPRKDVVPMYVLAVWSDVFRPSSSARLRVFWGVSHARASG